MKKLVFVALLMFSVTSFAQVKFTPYAEAGYFNGGFNWTDSLTVYPKFNSSNDWLANRIYAELCNSAEWKNIVVETSVRTIMTPNRLLSYTPLQGEYKVGLFYRYKNIQFNAEHLCSHGVDEMHFRYSYTKIGVRVYLISEKN
jgi:hypothetical protein